MDRRRRPQGRTAPPTWSWYPPAPRWSPSCWAPAAVGSRTRLVPQRVGSPRRRSRPQRRPPDRMSPRHPGRETAFSPCSTRRRARCSSLSTPRPPRSASLPAPSGPAALPAATMLSFSSPARPPSGSRCAGAAARSGRRPPHGGRRDGRQPAALHRPVLRPGAAPGPVHPGRAAEQPPGAQGVRSPSGCGSAYGSCSEAPAARALGPGRARQRPGRASCGRPPGWSRPDHRRTERRGRLRTPPPAGASSALGTGAAGGWCPSASGTRLNLLRGRPEPGAPAVPRRASVSSSPPTRACAGGGSVGSTRPDWARVAGGRPAPAAHALSGAVGRHLP